MKVFKSFFTFSFITLISRIFGFIRDVALASMMATGVLSDTFFASFRFISIIKSLFADGPMSAAFIPTYIQKENSVAKQFACNILSSLTLLILTLCGFLWLITPFILHKIAPGLTDDIGQFTIMISNFRLMLPYCFFITIAAFFGCILQAKHKVYGTAVLPIVINIVFIGAALLAKFTELENTQIVKLMSFSVAFAGSLQLILLFFMLKFNKIALNFSRNFWNKETLNCFKKLATTMFSGCLNRTNILVNLHFASAITGMTSYIYYADRIVHLPVSLIGVAMNVAFLPEISRIIKKNNHEKANFVQNRIMEFSLLLCVPIAVLMFLFSQEITYALFFRGKFTINDVQETAYILKILALSIAPMIMSQTLIVNFFARQDTKTPLLISCVVFASNLLGNIYLKDLIGLSQAIVYSYILSIGINVSLMTIISYRRKYFVIDKIFVINLNKMLIALVAMMVGLLIVNKSLSWFAYDMADSLKLILTVFFATVVYIFAVFSLKIYSLKDLKSNFSYIS